MMDGAFALNNLISSLTISVPDVASDTAALKSSNAFLDIMPCDYVERSVAINVLTIDKPCEIIWVRESFSDLVQDYVNIVTGALLLARAVGSHRDMMENGSPMAIMCFKRVPQFLDKTRHSLFLKIVRKEHGSDQWRLSAFVTSHARGPTINEEFHEV